MTREKLKQRLHRAFRVLPLWVVVVAVMAAFVPAGLFGATRYLNNYWVYRGYPPPSDPGYVTQRGTTETFSVTSAAVGGRSQRVVVFLPPGYAQQPARRYPVFYLLHGFPGRPDAFLLTVRAGVVEDILLAKKKIQPMILVMPMGSTGLFTDEEWANGIHPNSAWETFVTRDVVHAIDARYRTIATGAGRALGGLSAGGYAALNIGLHHPGMFGTLESWSGYELAQNVHSVFGGNPARLALNSPLLQLPKQAVALRRAGTYVWFYSGSTDTLRTQNAQFDAALSRARVPHRYFVVNGGHNWSLWRGYASSAILTASNHLAHA
ncbi:MAG: alpha/beta hydrolase-fold protein [Actinomycetota bacterium]|nr:alpha/beta hydrolase-fold protein [Actinomycetota bacterium]